MMDAKALLDSLMGPSRDAALSEQKKGDGWKEKNVCKRYLVGFCPNNKMDNWFHNTRRDIGTCDKVHSERLKEDFDKHKDHDRYKLEYQKDFLIFLEGLVREADAWISREKTNCRGPGKITKMTDNTREKAREMLERSELLMKQAEDLAERGNVEASKQAVQTSTELKQEVADMKEKHSFMSEGEKVCEVCGVRCNPDEQADYQAHLSGKLHGAYQRIRATVKELRDVVKNAPASSSRPDKDGVTRLRDSDKRSRSRDRDRGRDRDRDRGSDKKGREEKEGGRGDRRDDRGRDRRERSRSRDRRRR
eukprot:TRINITY_DN32979_c0_g1_i1.p1 TRINITY_DN32979_c0_g1~~TRINITY_DN32979_c0_g1_i1.p1  ORF type:complete len:306 (-),score=77.98 TRINITY_DN32979_c0_g1_i1:49-966(-)